MKRKIAGCLILSYFLLLLAGCAQAESREQNTLTLRMGNKTYAEFEDALQEAFPDIFFEIEHYTGSSVPAYMRGSLIDGSASDLYFSSWIDYPEEQQEFLLDLSGYEFVGRYAESMLDNYDVDGHIYELPGPYMLQTMAYNKTLFKEKNWKIPQNHQELLDLCTKIRAETDMVPITFAGQEASYYFTYMSTLAQGGFLSTPDGTLWEENYLQGTASAQDGFGEGLQMLQELRDYDAFNGEQLASLSAMEATQQLVSRQAAMLAVFHSSDTIIEAVNQEQTTDKFGIMPFYGIDGMPVIGSMPTVQFGVNKRLAEPGNEKKLENAIRVMDWFSTPETMNYFRTSHTMILPLNDFGDIYTDPILQDLTDVYTGSYTALMLYNGYLDVMLPIGKRIQQAIAGRGRFDTILKEMDVIHRTSRRVIPPFLEDDSSLR